LLARPLVVTIDKSNALLSAVRNILGPSQCVVLCEFHIKQALMRWQTDNAIISDLKPTREQRIVLINRFKRVMGAVSPEDFLTKKNDFLDGLSDFITNKDLEAAISKYFNTYWFCERWACTFMISLYY
jgi:hypothetical protein